MNPYRLKLLLAPLAWGVLRRTVRIEGPEGPQGPPAGPVIFACLHRDILPAILYVRSWTPTLLVSSSPDGDILTRTLGADHYRYVRGATGEGGQAAFMALRRELEQGRCLGLAVDGPKGPFGVINEGVLQLARLSGAPIVPLRAVPQHAVILSTWDRTVVPRPFSRVQVRPGSPLTVGRGAGEAELAAIRTVLREFLLGEGGGDAGAGLETGR